MSEEKSRLRRWIIAPIVAQLTQGISPEKLSWSVSLGIVTGIFPVMGSTSLLCFIVGYFFKLNQPVLHVFNSAAYPLHLALIIVYIQFGQYLNGVPPISLSITELVNQFQEAPWQFIKDFSLAAFYGIQAWALSAIILIPLIRFISLPFLRKLLRKKSPEISM